jgi:tight adherence protein B
MILLLAAVAAGGFMFTGVLWATGFGAVTDTAGRLARLRNDQPAPGSSQGASSFNLRKRASVSVAGVNLVSTNISAQWTRQLERAGLALNAKEYFLLRTVVGLVLGAMAMLVLSFPPAALVAVVLGYLGVGMWLKRRITARTHKIEAQMVEMLQMLASGLRAGFGFLQALEASGDQLPDPLSAEIRRTMRDTAMGASVEQALSAFNERVGSSDLDIVITAILIQRSVGGNLAEILDNVAHTMRERERIRGEIRTLTAQQRLTGFVIGGIPIALLGIFSTINPAFTGLLFTDPLGRMMLGGALVLEFVGFLIIRKIVNIEV